MRKGKWSRAVVGISVEMIFCCVMLTAQTNTFPSSGNVGIGTTTPLNYLEIDGGDVNKVGMALENASGSLTILNLQASGSSGFGINGWANAGLIEAEAPNGLVIGSVNALGSGVGGPITFQINRAPVAIISTSGQVGIGTADPTAPLDIATGYASGDQVFNALTVQPAGGSAYGANGASINLDSVTNHGIQPVASIWSSLGNGGDGGVNYNGSLVFGTTHQGSLSPTEGMRLDPSGNVGIGTINPGAMLDVAGNVKISGSGASLTFPDGTVQSTAYVGTTCSTGGEQLGPATAPSGACSTIGAWAFSQDGHATFCASGTWTTKI